MPQRSLAMAVALALLARGMPGQAPARETPASAPSTATSAARALPDEGGTSGWSWSASAITYFVPDGRNYVQPTLVAKHDRLHLEARYNYEDLDTFSAWIGYELSAGSELALELTPMLGGVFGHTNGVAPGYKGSLSWRRLELYSEGEYLFDTDKSADSFFYNWSELTVAPLDWLRVGLVTQRTRAYQSERDIQRGLLLGVSAKRLDFTAYLFNPDDSEPIFGFAIGLGF